MRERCFRIVCRTLLMAVALCGVAVLLWQSPPRVQATDGTARQAARLPRAETALPPAGEKLIGPSRAGVLPQPDLWIAVAGTPYIGNNVYLIEAQTVAHSIQPFSTAIYHLTVQNDDSVDDTLLVIGTAGGDGWTITYHDALTGGTNITSLVTTTGWPVGPLAAGATRAFRVEVTPPAHAAPDLPYTVQVSAISLNDPEAADTVAAITTQGIINGWDLVSVNNAGLPGNANSINPSMDASGRYVAFESQATNLVAGDTNNCRDVFLFDRKLRTVERISVSSTGVQGNGESFEPVVSGNGRFVAFRSHATNLVAGDTNAYADIFLRDRQTQTTTRVSVSSAGTQGRLGHSYAPTISFDGRYVAFHSYARELVPTDLDTRADVFLRDTQAGTTQRISVAVTGTQGTGDSFGPSISADGRYIAYWSGATNLVLNDTNNHTDIFVYDRVTGQNTRVSVADGGVQANNSSFNPSISGNGRYVAFESLATNLVPADGNNARDIFVHDRLRGLTTCVSVTSDGVQGNANSESARISHDGMMVAFYSAAFNLAPGDTNALADVFVHNRQTGVTTCVSTNALGKPGNNESKGPAISANGRFVGFHTFATDLSPAGQNFTYDVYVRDTMTEEPTLPYQPDLWLRNSADARYIGNKLYTLAEQTKAQSVAIGETAVYHVLAENDGSRLDVLVITGPAGGDGWTVRYFDALEDGADITDQVTGGGWETPVLGFEEGVTLRVEVTPDATVPPMQTRAVQVTATSQTDGAFTDAVSVATTRKTLSHVTLTMTPPSPVRVGSPVTLTAEAFGGNLVQYRFYAMREGETGWTRLRDYNLEPTYVWTPGVAGKYTLLVWAREVGRTSNWDAYTTRPYTVASAALESVTLSAVPASPVPPNTVVTLLAQAQGGVAPQYRFYVQRKGETTWTMIRPYAASPTCAWQPTAIGQYTLLVWARELNSPFNWDKFATRPFVVAMDPPVITLNPFVVNEQVGIGTLSGHVANADGNRADIIVNGFATTLTLNADGTFSTLIILVPGTNTIIVRASNAAGTTTSTPIVYEYDPESDMFFRVTLTWDGSGDLDLHTWSPSMAHCYFGQPSIAHGNLDVDNVWGNGPENFTCTALADGRFRVAVNSFSAPVGRQATIRVLVTKGPNAGQSYTFGPYTFTGSSYYGYPITGNTASWWRPCDVLIEGEMITAVAPDTTPLSAPAWEPSGSKGTAKQP